MVRIPRFKVDVLVSSCQPFSIPCLMLQSKLQEDSSPPEAHRPKQSKRRLSDEDDEIEEVGPTDFMSAKQKLVSNLQLGLH